MDKLKKVRKIVLRDFFVPGSMFMRICSGGLK